MKVGALFVKIVDEGAKKVLNDYGSGSCTGVGRISSTNSVYGERSVRFLTKSRES